MHIVCMYLHTGLLAITTGRVSNSSFDNKGCHSPGEVYSSFLCMNWGAKSNSEILTVQDPASQATVPVPLVWRMAVHVGLHEFGGLLFRGSQELFNGCIRRQLINSPGCPDCGSMSGLCHLTNYLRTGKWAWMRDTYTQALDLLCPLSTCTGRTRPGNRSSTIRMWTKEIQERTPNLQITGVGRCYWGGERDKSCTQWCGGSCHSPYC